MALIRLNKYIASCGAASRRKADELILAGRVSVDDLVVCELGYQIDDSVARVRVDSALIGARSLFVYYAVYKPRGYVSTTTDRFGEQTVVSLIPSSERLFIVGRLDKDSEGLMILTNDGDYAYRMTHPKYEVEKRYHVLVRGRVTSEVLHALSCGVELDDGKTAPCKVFILERDDMSGEVLLEFVLHEGRKRQIRRMCALLHLFVVRLVRVAIGDVTLESLQPGHYRQLSISSKP